MFNSYDENQLSERYPEVEFGKFVSIGKGVKIGKGSKISDGVKIYPDTIIGENVVILENTVIGRETILPAQTDLIKRKIENNIHPTSINHHTVIGASVVLYRGVTIGLRNIICDLTSIREKCVLGDDVLLGRSVMVQVDTHIGSRTKIMDTCHLPGNMKIEEDVFLSTHVCGASENTLGRSDSTENWAGPYISKGAYVGVNATLLPGIKIGEHAVVAAGSVVTKDVESLTLVMGVPAVFKKNVSRKI